MFSALKKMNDENQDISNYVNLLYDQALLMAGLNIDEPGQYAQKITELMMKTIK